MLILKLFEDSIEIGWARVIFKQFQQVLLPKLRVQQRKKSITFIALMIKLATWIVGCLLHCKILRCKLAKIGLSICIAPPLISCLLGLINISVAQISARTSGPALLSFIKSVKISTLASSIEFCDIKRIRTTDAARCRSSFLSGFVSCKLLLTIT